jgi:hypothetical protein
VFPFSPALDNEGKSIYIASAPLGGLMGEKAEKGVIGFWGTLLIMAGILAPPVVILIKFVWLGHTGYPPS